MRDTPKLEIAALNRIGKQLQAKSRTTQAALFIKENLQEFIRATKLPTPRGACRKDYRLSITPHDERFDQKSGERRLEAALWHQFETGSDRFLDGVAQIAAFQVPLYSKQKKEGWGAIDLVGVDNETGYPVVIELKIAKKTTKSATKAVEPPLRAVVEALAYMLALRGNWADFGPQWHQRTNQVLLPAPKSLTAVILATEEYWEAVKSDTYLMDSLGPVRALVDELARVGFQFRFASVATDSQGKTVVVRQVREIEIPLGR
jgi:hypothetical protein